MWHWIRGSLLYFDWTFSGPVNIVWLGFFHIAWWDKDHKPREISFGWNWED